MKVKMYIKEALVFGVLFVVISSAVSIYRTSQMQIGDAVCQKRSGIVYFWATWCPVCKMTSPNVSRISEEFVVLGIAVRSGEREKVQAYMQEHDLHFANRNDFDGTTAAGYGVNVFPTIVFCKNGHVKMAEVGYMSTLGLWLRAWLFTS